MVSAAYLTRPSHILMFINDALKSDVKLLHNETRFVRMHVCTH